MTSSRPATSQTCPSTPALLALALCVTSLFACKNISEPNVSGMRGAGPYLRGGAGPAVFDSSTGDDDTFTGDVDETDLALSIGGGYRFNPNVAVELAWTDLGEVAYDGSYSGTPTRGTVEASSFELSVIGSYPLHEAFDLTGRAGLTAWSAEDSGVEGGFPYDEKEDGVDPLLAIGAEARLASQFALRLEVVHFFDVWETDPTVVLVQLLYGF